MIYLKKGLNRFRICTLLISTILLMQTSFYGFQPEYPGTVTASAHSGRTDSKGGHRDNKNKSGLGSYHYHCGGYPAHTHKNGVCPYSSTSSKSSSNTSNKTNSSAKNEIKKAQEKLNDLGYNCGTPDGIIGSKTKKAIKSFQKDNDLKVTGTLNSETKKKLGL